MISVIKKGIFCILFLLLALTDRGFAAEFSADMVISSKMAGEDMTGRIFVKGNAMRQEMNTPAGVHTTIVAPGAKVVYILLPGQKKYMEAKNSKVTLDESENFETKFADKAKLTVKPTETLEGYSCKVYNIVYNDKTLGESTVWIATKLNYPLKTQANTPQGSTTILYRNIKVEKLQDSLFSLPQGYTKISM